MIRLDIPYRSQWDTDAGRYNADCGPTCVAMVLNYRQIAMTPDRVYDFIDFYVNAAEAEKAQRRGITYVAELMRVLRQHGVETSYRKYENREAALAGLRASLDAGDPLVALVKYAPWREATVQTYLGGHFVVVTGYDEHSIFMHDPLLDHSRSHFALSHDLFCAGWGGFVGNENPNWACFIVEGGGAPPSVEPEAPEPETSVESGAPTMDDTDRRIRALAAYRYADAPDLADSETRQLWEEHLGDFGLTYDRHVVVAGDTLYALARDHYDDGERWPMLRAYNGLGEEGHIWVGQTILLPHLGESGATTTPALPSSPGAPRAAARGAAQEAAQRAAQDYNAFADDFVGVGFVDES